MMRVTRLFSCQSAFIIIFRGASSTAHTNVHSIGEPCASIVAAGNCQFKEDWGKASLKSIKKISADTRVFSFSLPDKTKSLGLSTCACILAKGGPAGETIRPYTPVSTNALIGEFELMIKVYPQGEFSKWLDGCEEGTVVEFKHIPFNIKIQYPFQCKKLGILCGGTGITPMIQALHAVLGTAEDKTLVSMLYGSRTAEDILVKDTLDSWEKGSRGRLKVTHVLSESNCETKGVETGYIDREKVLKYMPAPSEDCLIFVCGPPAMYESLCGPRGQDLKEGSELHALGYRNDQVIKF